ncbi:MAG: tetratricopeptide repeat protein [Kofleriaceae bacterium]|nr:tetratricopeptide repeat protein [Kofleriaceae bacterium]
MTTRGLALLAGAACLAGAARADAQSTRYPPPPVDHDAEAEQYSDFWENAIEPGRDRYDTLVERAAKLVVRRADENRDAAVEMLDEATTLLPDHADAWAWLGLVREDAGDWAGCAEALGKAWTIDAGWHAAPRPLALALGTCRARAGDLDGAAAALERLVDHGDERVETYYRLGEVYLAQGRLDDARDVLTVALDGSPADTFYSHAAWALAVTEDRARDPAATEAAGTVALARDPQLYRAGDPPGGFAIASDRLYYQALAATFAGQPELALVRFRQYAAADTPWQARARDHVDALAGFDVATRVRVDKTDVIDDAAVVKAMTRIEPTLRACLADAPQLLLTVRHTVLGPPRTDAGTGAARRPAPPPPRNAKRKPAPAKPVRPHGGTIRPPPPRAAPPAGTQVTITATGDVDAETAEAAVGCVVRGAARLALPAPRTPGTWLSAAMPLVYR